MKYAQTQVEFILAVFIFFIVVFFLFISLFLRMPSEFGKIQEQTACLNAETLSNLVLLETGSPLNWNISNLQKFGLSNGSLFYIRYDAWNFAKQIGYVGVWNRTELNTSFQLSYNVYAFGWKNDTSCAPINSSVLCRQGNVLAIYTNASLPSTLNLDLFFPYETSIVLNSSNLETNDQNSTTIENDGSLVKLTLNTNATDADNINITLSSLYDLAYIKNMKYEMVSGSAYPVYIGSTSIKETFGSAGASSSYNYYCEFERRVLLAGNGGETFPTRFNTLTW